MASTPSCPPPQFYEYFAKHLNKDRKISLFNCTEGGIFLNGFEHIGLEEFIETELNSYESNLVETTLNNVRRDMAVLTDNVNTVIAKLERAEGTWEMAENLYEVLANKVNEMEWDIKDLNREINY